MLSLKVYVDDFAIYFRFDKAADTNDIIRMQVANAYRKLNRRPP